MIDIKTWEQRVAAWRTSGQSARAFSEGREYSVHMLRYWGRRVGTAAPTKVRRSSSGASAPEPAPVRLARVLRTGPQPIGTATAPVVIELGRAKVAVSPGFDRPTLAAVLELLGSGGGQ